MTTSAIDFEVLAGLMAFKAQCCMEPEKVKEFIGQLIEVGRRPIDLIPEPEDDEVPGEGDGIRTADYICAEMAKALEKIDLNTFELVF